jgi:hypothetical protein
MAIRSSVRASSTIFTANSAHSGGGIAIDHSWLVTSGCMFANNSAGGCASIAPHSAALSRVRSDNLELMGLVVLHSAVRSCADVGQPFRFGGAIDIAAPSVAVVTNTIFSSNIASSGGGAIFLSGRNGTTMLTLSNATFIGNAAPSGRDVVLSSNARVTVARGSGTPADLIQGNSTGEFSWRPALGPPTAEVNARVTGAMTGLEAVAGVPLPNILSASEPWLVDAKRVWATY